MVYIHKDKYDDYRASKAFIDLMQKWLPVSKVTWGVLNQHKRIKVNFLH